MEIGGCGPIIGAMTDQRTPVETTAGLSPGPSVGERILVALAALALLVGGLIVVGNLLQQDEVANVASGSPEPTERPSRTPRPTSSPRPIPTPLELVLESAPLPSVEPVPELFSGLIRARVELQILGGAQLDAAPIGVLAAGDLIGASELPDLLGEEGWVGVGWGHTGPRGFIATRAAGVDLVDRYPQPPSAASGYISTLAAGPEGFVAIGSQPGTAGYPLPSMLISSADGARWQVASAPVSALNPRTAVWGPAGWLLMSDSFDSNKIWLSTSADGSVWTNLGMLRGPDGGPYPQGLAASDAGYLFAGVAFFDNQPSPLWFSADGVNWHEVHPGLAAREYTIGGTPGGFYASSRAGYAPEAAFSVDGITWSPVAGGPVALTFQPVAVGDRWFAIDTYGETGTPLAAPRPWLGRVIGGRLSWQLMPGAAAFSGAVVTALVSTGEEAIAFGWDRTTAAALTWTTTGSGWIRSALPVAFDGAPEVAAAGSAGVVVVGHRLSAFGDDPIVWSRVRDGFWQPERDPVIARIPEPSLADCAPLPRDALAFLILEWETAPLCYGDTPITFRAWSTHCGYCGEEPSYGTYDPEWLGAPVANLLFLSPTGSGNAIRPAVLPPTLATSPPAAWLETWLEITGHFDDPASETCQYTPPPDDLSYVNPASGVHGCRQQFVVTAARVVDGP